MFSGESHREDDTECLAKGVWDACSTDDTWEEQMDNPDSTPERQPSVPDAEDPEAKDVEAETEGVISINEEIAAEFASAVEAIKKIVESFSLPAIMSPSESDAQCAAMYQEGVVDGVISDDNDLLLFGAGVVYRHFFRKNKKIAMYKIGDCGFTREELIRLAYLLGCDYSAGKKGIGPRRAVKALESVGEQELHAIRGIYNIHTAAKVEKAEFVKPDVQRIQGCLKEIGVEDRKTSEVVLLIESMQKRTRKA